MLFTYKVHLSCFCLNMRKIFKKAGSSIFCYDCRRVSVCRQVVGTTERSAWAQEHLGGEHVCGQPVCIGEGTLCITIWAFSTHEESFSWCSMQHDSVPQAFQKWTRSMDWWYSSVDCYYKWNNRTEWNWAMAVNMHSQSTGCSKVLDKQWQWSSVPSCLCSNIWRDIMERNVTSLLHLHVPKRVLSCVRLIYRHSALMRRSLLPHCGWQFPHIASVKANRYLWCSSLSAQFPDSYGNVLYPDDANECNAC